MSWVAAAVAGGAIIGGVASNRAASTQSRAGQGAIDLQRDIYNTTRGDLSPYREAGLAALTRLQRLMGIGPGGGPTDTEYGSLSRDFSSADLAADPVYNSGLEFGLNEGTKAINARAIQAGGYDSGATLKALTRYGNDYASTKGAEAYNRFITSGNAKYSRLSGIAGSGQNAANFSGNLGANYATNVGNTMMGVANAQGAATIAGGNAITGGLNNLAGYSMLQQLSPGAQRGSDTQYIEMPR